MLADTSLVGNSGISTQKTPTSAMNAKYAPDLFAIENKSELEKQMKDAEALEKRILEDDRIRALEDLNRQGNKGNQTILMPQYKKDERLKVDREFDIPPKTLFIGLGWDEDATTKRKHYRKYFADELENDKEIFPNPSPFQSYGLKRGQSRGNGDSLFSFSKTSKKDASGEASTEQIVGKFKGIIQVQTTEDKEEYNAHKK